MPIVNGNQRRVGRLFWYGVYLLVGVAGLLFGICFIYFTGWVSFNLAFKLALVAWIPYLILAPLIWWFAHRYPLERAVWRKHLCVHISANVAFIVLAQALQFVLAAAFLDLPPLLPVKDFETAPTQRIDNLMELPPPLLGHSSLRRPMLGPMAPARTQFNIPIYWLIVFVAHLVGYSVRLRQREQQQVRLQSELIQARLQALQMQLQPHFLFNTLNTIAALIREQPCAAEEMLANLSDLLRATVNHKQEAETTLENELLVLGFYLDIQLVRFGHRLRYEQTVPANVMQGLVPVFILQPLVENAIKHGIGQSEKGAIKLESRLIGNYLRIEISDNGSGLAPDQFANLLDGIGLGNTRTRLRTLYGANHRFTLCHASSGGLCVELEIPFHLQPMLSNVVPADSQRENVN